MKLLKGKPIAEKILNNLKLEIKLQAKKPGLAVVLIGDDKASRIYVNLKKKAARKVGVGFYIFKFGDKAEENKIIKKIKDLNADKKISGIIVQFPLPRKFNAQRIINEVDPKKDADGFHPKNLKLFLLGKGNIKPVFPMAIIKLIPETVLKRVLKRSFRNFRNKAAIISNSEKFGKVMRAILERKGISAECILLKKIDQTSYYTRRRSTLSVEELKKIKNADIIVSAIGIPKLIKGEMIKKGAIVIDGGITKKGKKVLGDVDFKSVKNIASYLSPVPGGIGPVTVACLLENVYLLTKKQK